MLHFHSIYPLIQSQRSVAEAAAGVRPRHGLQVLVLELSVAALVARPGIRHVAGLGVLPAEREEQSL